MAHHNYRGHRIEFMPESQTWRWRDFERTDLDEVISYVDQYVEAEFEPHPAYGLKRAGDAPRNVEILRVSTGKLFVGIDRESKAQIAERKLYRANPSNGQVLARLKTLQQQRDQLLIEMKSLFESLEVVTIADLKPRRKAD